MPTDTEHCAVRLRAAVMHLARQLRTDMQRDGLGSSALSVLGLLYRVGTMSPTELARREGVKLQSLTRLLAGLESEGWIERTTSPADARQSLLSISRRGITRLGAAVRGGERSLAAAIESRLSADEQDLLLRACTLLDTLGAALAGEDRPS